MNKATGRRITALEKANQQVNSVALLGFTPWQHLQTQPILTIDQWTALAAPQQAALIREYQP
jgi:hypothetical protein